MRRSLPRPFGAVDLDPNAPHLVKVAQAFLQGNHGPGEASPSSPHAAQDKAFNTNVVAGTAFFPVQGFCQSGRERVLTRDVQYAPAFLLQRVEVVSDTFVFAHRFFFAR